jgi:hypothetical protein
MTTIAVTRDDTGKLTGLGEKGRKAYARFKKRIEELEIGEVMNLSVWFPRNPKLHGLHFALLSAVFDSQEQFENLEQFRMWVQVGAGHAKFVPGPHGRMVALPESIAWHKMDDAEFQTHHEAVKAFLRSERALAFIWPATTPADAAASMDAILEGFER